jgi:hypothetical protein
MGSQLSTTNIFDLPALLNQVLAATDCAPRASTAAVAKLILIFADTEINLGRLMRKVRERACDASFVENWRRAHRLTSSSERHVYVTVEALNPRSHCDCWNFASTTFHDMAQHWILLQDMF